MLRPFLSYCKNMVFTLEARADLAHFSRFCILFCIPLQSAGVSALVLGTEGPSEAPRARAGQSSSKGHGGAPCSVLQERQGQGDKEKCLEVTQLPDVTAEIELGLPPTSFSPLKIPWTVTLFVVSFRHLQLQAGIGT